MAKLDKIPAQQLEALELLTKLNEEDFRQLVQAVKETPATLNPALFFKSVASRLSSISSATGEAIMETLCGLSFLKQIRSATIPDIMTGVEESTRSGPQEKGQLLITDLKTLQTRLTQLLDLESSLGITARAIDVLMEHDHVFGFARIVSDIRPVFTVAVDSVAGFITHNLCIHYNQDGQHKKFYVALDNNDLKTLKEAITRAEQKTDILKVILKKASVPYLDIE
jgi:hypothetical protein